MDKGLLHENFENTGYAVLIFYVLACTAKGSHSSPSTNLEIA
jgi:hypothetical protein